ncbi:MAG: TolC family protein [Bacteroidetes bacterium]|nr:TolC family protein [Bacteroidota bacterium]
MNFIKAVSFALVLLAANNFIIAQGPDKILDAIINRAVEVSPRLNVLQNKKEISISKIPQSVNLPDPMLTLGLANLPTNSFSFTQEPMTGKIIGLSQAVPFPGKLNAAENVLSRDAEINQQEIDDAKNEIINEIKKIYYDLRFTREAIRIAEQTKNNLRQIAQVVNTKYTVSKASQQNIIQIDVEITKVNEKILELKGKESSYLASINSFLLLEFDSPVQTGKIPEILAADLSINMLEEYAKENRPYLKGISIAKEKALYMKKLVNYDFYPNFNFTVQYSQRDEISKTSTPLNDFLSIFVGFNLPLNYGGKSSAKIEESELMEKMYSDQYKASLQMLNKSFGQSTSKLNELKEREKLIREGLLPQTEQLLKSALANYQVGEIDFINVIDAQNKLNDIQTNLYSLRTMYFKELSQLEFLTGKKLFK